MAIGPITRITRDTASHLDLSPIVLPVVTKLLHTQDTLSTAYEEQVVNLDVRPNPQSFSHPPVLASVETVANSASTKTFKEELAFENGYEVFYYKQLIASMIDQRNNHHDHAMISQDLAMRERNIRKVLDQESLRLKKDLDKASFFSRVCSWVSWVINVITFGCLLAGAAIMAITRSGSAVGLISMYAQGMLSVSKSINLGFKAYADYSKDAHESKLIGIKEERKASISKLNSTIQQRKQAYNSEAQINSLQKQAIKNRRQASN